MYELCGLRKAADNGITKEFTDGGTYYVNCGRDNFLYYLKDGKSSRMIEEIVSSLNLWKGELYFVLHVDGEIYLSVRSNYLLRLNKKDRTLTEVTNQEQETWDNRTFTSEGLDDLSTFIVKGFPVIMNGIRMEYTYMPCNIVRWKTNWTN